MLCYSFLNTVPQIAQIRAISIKANFWRVGCIDMQSKRDRDEVRDLYNKLASEHGPDHADFHIQREFVYGGKEAKLFTIKQKYELVEDFIKNCVDHAQNQKHAVYAYDFYHQFQNYYTRKSGKYVCPLSREYFIPVFISKLQTRHKFYFKSDFDLKRSKFYGIKIRGKEEREKSPKQKADDQWLSLFDFDPEGRVGNKTLHDLYERFYDNPQFHDELSSIHFYIYLLVKNAFNKDESFSFNEILGLKLSAAGEALMKQMKETDTLSFFDEEDD